MGDLKLEMPGYERYKDSGVEWIGEIPEHWETTRLKFISRVQSGLTLGKHYPQGNLSKLPYLRVANVQDGYFNLTDVATIAIPKKDEKKYLLSKHDILVTEGGDIDKLGRGTVWEAEIEPCLHQNHIFAIRIFSKKINSKFIALFMTTPKVRRYFIDTAIKTTNLASTNRTTLGNLALVIPPLADQNKIQSHIQTQAEKIDHAIAIKEKQINLLKERKQILIQEAVTKGLDPDVPMRDSGVEWIGEVPEHWETTRLKFISRIQSGLTLGKHYSQGNLSELPYLRVANVQDGYFNLTDVATIAVPQKDEKKYLLSKHDILVTEGGDIDKLGRGTVWEAEIEPCLHQNHIFAIRVLSKKINVIFIAQFMTTSKVRRYFIDTATKTTNLASTNRTTLGNLTLVIPPLADQNKIQSHIQTQSEKIDKAIAIQQQMIEKLKEYKATLINAAVTGKIKVPGIETQKEVA